MGKKEATRQRQLAKKKSKRDNKRKELARRTSQDPTIALEHIASTPVYDAQIPDGPGQGLGVALIARRLLDGRIAYASYLLDTYCLGVKDTFWQIKSLAEYHEFIEQSPRVGRLRKASGECVAKLVLGAVEYAHAHGFSPHEDFRHTRKLLEGIDPAACTEAFEYGHNGRPLFIQGPYDTPARVNQIMARLGDTGDSVLGSPPPPSGLLRRNRKGTDAPSLGELYEAFADDEDSQSQDLIEDEDLDDEDLVDMREPDSSK